VVELYAVGGSQCVYCRECSENDAGHGSDSEQDEEHANVQPDGNFSWQRWRKGHDRSKGQPAEWNADGGTRSSRRYMVENTDYPPSALLDGKTLASLA